MYSMNSSNLSPTFARKRSGRRLPSTPTSTRSTPCTYRNHSADPRIRSGQCLYKNENCDSWDDDEDVFVNVETDFRFNRHRSLLAVKSDGVRAKLANTFLFLLVCFIFF
ncbi:hypothetical protein Tcan_12032 [Toxocara canis]|uniref:Uncharacterized protein n=1 Tax=Toxocara canis TaxID=6265 RepID=A0A0B2VJ31_TOXCA|nr:hypothetical protein Tcan_12032 [Toxocara canis]